VKKLKHKGEKRNQVGRFVWTEMQVGVSPDRPYASDVCQADGSVGPAIAVLPHEIGNGLVGHVGIIDEFMKPMPCRASFLNEGGRDTPLLSSELVEFK
jgi:hypothetical protein